MKRTGPDDLTLETVWERDQGKCAWCGKEITGERTIDWSVQHRRPRRAGGDRRPDTNLPSNLVLLHGSGTTRCHGHVESFRTDSYNLGFLLRYPALPSQERIFHRVHGGWVYLTDDGWYSVERPPLEVA